MLNSRKYTLAASTPTFVIELYIVLGRRPLWIECWIYRSSFEMRISSALEPGCLVVGDWDPQSSYSFHQYDNIEILPS
jgi:hypothetical protein